MASHSNYTPVPTVTPSIENGYTVISHQSVTFTIKLINQPNPLYEGANVISYNRRWLKSENIPWQLIIDNSKLTLNVLIS